MSLRVYGTWQVWHTLILDLPVNHRHPGEGGRVSAHLVAGVRVGLRAHTRQITWPENAVGEAVRHLGDNVAQARVEHLLTTRERRGHTARRGWFWRDIKRRVARRAAVQHHTAVLQKMLRFEAPVSP